MNRALQWGKLALVFVAAAGVMLAQAPKAQAAKPVAVVQRFYEWYLQSLVRDRDPLTQERATLRTYVSDALIKEIDRRAKSPEGLDADYFLQAQDYLDEWKAHISVVQTAANGTDASVVVTLGPPGPSAHKLSLVLKHEAAGWKIAKVQARK